MALERRFDLIVFDWDGTLMDSAGAIVNAIRAACRDFVVAAWGVSFRAHPRAELAATEPLGIVDQPAGLRRRLGRHA